MIWQFFRPSIIEIPGPIEAAYPPNAITNLQSSSGNFFQVSDLAYLVELIGTENFIDPWGHPVPPYEIPFKVGAVLLLPCPKAEPRTIIEASMAEGRENIVPCETAR